jgi:hypothetical protein
VSFLAAGCASHAVATAKNTQVHSRPTHACAHESAVATYRRVAPTRIRCECACLRNILSRAVTITHLAVIAHTYSRLLRLVFAFQRCSKAIAQQLSQTSGDVFGPEHVWPYDQSLRWEPSELALYNEGATYGPANYAPLLSLDVLYREPAAGAAK